MTTATDHTGVARHLVGDFVQRAGKTFLVVRCGDGFAGQQTIRVTPDDVAAFFATQARTLASGCRTLAGLTGNWRAVSDLAQACLNWFKKVNVVGMRRAAHRRGLIPRFWTTQATEEPKRERSDRTTTPRTVVSDCRGGHEPRVP